MGISRCCSARERRIQLSPWGSCPSRGPAGICSLAAGWGGQLMPRRLPSGHLGPAYLPRASWAPQRPSVGQVPPGAPSSLPGRQHLLPSWCSALGQAEGAEPLPVLQTWCPVLVQLQDGNPGASSRGPARAGLTPELAHLGQTLWLGPRPGLPQASP